MALSLLASGPGSLQPVVEYSCGRTLGPEEGVAQVAAFVVVLLVAVGVVLLLMRAAATAAGGGRARTPRPARRTPPRGRRPIAPDDDPDFLRELDRRNTHDDGTPA
jgi:hypothetical protein